MQSLKYLLLSIGIFTVFGAETSPVSAAPNTAEQTISNDKSSRNPDDADKQIMQDTTYYRVYDLTTNSTKPSYFHNSLNGYHAAKLRRYNEVFNWYVAKNNLNVLNMLNTKYIIASNKDGGVFTFTNDETNGSAWFIDGFQVVQSADEEIQALDSLDNKHRAVINQKELKTYFKTDKAPTYEVDSTAVVALTKHFPNDLKYKTNNPHDGFIVFSEVYYGHGWQAFIDGEKVPYVRVDYTLRGIAIPAGEHHIEFKFDPQIVKTGSRIALASSVLVLLIVLGGLLYSIKNRS